MTIYTRLSRVAKRNAYLAAKHGSNIEALIEELQDHAIRLPFDVKTADFELMKKRFYHIQSISAAVAYKFPSEMCAALPNLTGEVLSFVPSEHHVEVVLKTHTGWGDTRKSVYRAVSLPESLFSGRTDVVAMWTRKTLRSGAEARREAEERKLSEHAKEARVKRDALDKDIAETERALATIADRRARRAERKARSNKARAEYAARNAQ